MADEETRAGNAEEAQGGPNLKTAIANMQAAYKANRQARLNWLTKNPDFARQLEAYQNDPSLSRPALELRLDHRQGDEGDENYQIMLQYPSPLERQYSDADMRLACQKLLSDEWQDDGQHGRTLTLRLDPHAPGGIEDHPKAMPPVFGAISQIVAAMHFAEVGGANLASGQLQYVPPANFEGPYRELVSDHYLTQHVRHPVDYTYVAETDDSPARLIITLPGEPDFPAEEMLQQIRAAIRNAWPDIDRGTVARG